MNDSQKIWRYMDFSKFISLLSNEALFFACALKFNDPFEGYKPKSEMEAWSKFLRLQYNGFLKNRKQLESLFPGGDLSQLDEAIKELPSLKSSLRIATSKFGVSCWHINEEESDAMWKLYCENGRGIAIESTAGRLYEAILNKEGLIIDSVRYSNFHKDPIEQGHKHYGLFQKRMAFEYEKELRATVLLPEINYGQGMLVKCDLEILINKIHVSPLCEEHMKGDIEKLCFDRIKPLNKPVFHSNLYNQPDY